MDFGNRDVAAIHFFLSGSFDRFSYVTVGHGAKQHVVAAGLLLDREAADRVEGGAEGDRLSLEGSLTLRPLARRASTWRSTAAVTGWALPVGTRKLRA